MRTRELSLITALLAALALPAAAQTMQATPDSSNDLSIPTSPAKAQAAAAQSNAETQAPLVDINSASAVDLDMLPGIGKARSSAIIQHRPYKAKQELLTRHVLPPNVYDEIKNKVTASQG